MLCAQSLQVPFLAGFINVSKASGTPLQLISNPEKRSSVLKASSLQCTSCRLDLSRAFSSDEGWSSYMINTGPNHEYVLARSINISSTRPLGSYKSICSLSPVHVGLVQPLQASTSAVMCHLARRQTESSACAFVRTRTVKADRRVGYQYRVYPAGMSHAIQPCEHQHKP